MKTFLEKLINKLKEKELDSNSAFVEANIGMCGLSASRYEGEEFAYSNSIKIVNQLIKEYKSKIENIEKLETKIYTLKKSNKTWRRKCQRLRKQLKENKWIPCSEKLPEENTEVRIKFNNGTEFQGGIDENGWYLGSKNIMFDYFDQICLWEDIKIVAWKYL